MSSMTMNDSDCFDMTLDTSIMPVADLSQSKYRSKSYCKPIGSLSVATKYTPIKVALRIRPLINDEISSSESKECLKQIHEEDNQIVIGENNENNKSFTYDHVFSKYSAQREVYQESVKPLISTLFQGYNATVLAYGQTGSGKTYSMGLNHALLSNAIESLIDERQGYGDLDAEVGLIPRVLSGVFKKIADERARSRDVTFTVKVSFLEVYNEEIKDLLRERPASETQARVKESLDIREKNNVISVRNLSEISVTSALSVLTLLKQVCSLRVARCTAMNEESSRSHAIFTITLEQAKRGEYELIRSKFHLVDLAGSEQQKKTKACGPRFRESIKINLGLFALGNVISQLGKKFVGHVPYRESKLTRLLQDSLGGNSHTVMLACVSPAASSIRETKNTLRFASRVKKIKNKPVVNIDPKEELIIELRKKVKDLEEQLEMQEKSRAVSRSMKSREKSDYGCQTMFEFAEPEEEMDKEEEEDSEEEEEEDSEDSDEESEETDEEETEEEESEEEETEEEESEDDDDDDDTEDDEDETDEDETRTMQDDSLENEHADSECSHFIGDL